MRGTGSQAGEGDAGSPRPRAGSEGDALGPDQAPRSIYIRGRGASRPLSPGSGLRGGRASEPLPRGPPGSCGRPVAEVGAAAGDGQAGEPRRRGRNGGRLRAAPGRYSAADGTPALPGAHPSGLWPLGLPLPVPGRQLSPDGASPTFVRQVRHFTSLSPPTRPRAGPGSLASCQDSCARALNKPTLREADILRLRAEWRAERNSSPRSERAPAH